MKHTLITVVAMLLISFAVFAQAEIKGPICVISGTEYDYFISGNPDSVSEISVCIKGGSFTNTKDNCKTIKPYSSVRIIWDEKANKPELSISFTGGNNSLEIKVTDSLFAGEITGSIKKQMLKYDSVAAIVNCSLATGGSCSPAYGYQWQRSDNALSWTDIEGATGQDLPTQGRLKEPVFYRRKVTEKSSGTIKYSTIATVFVEADYKNR